ncbi:hypothetical protein BaRGS_00016373 [Batillaria attramentaria]|uniref:15-oxoprostaglandin 13-reductase n=1 Tax=Batillaria attramentaria TaxID=370345 RepID=A0ABD0KZ42_9CAEN
MNLTHQGSHREHNLRVIFHSRPGVNGEPTADNFKTEECPMPDAESLPRGFLMIKNLYISVDPALRCRMNEDTGVHYMKAYQLNTPVDGLGGVGEVMASADPKIEVGDIVSATFLWPWASYFTIESTNVRKLQKDLFSQHPSLALSLLGGTGLTAYLGMVERGHVTREGQQTVVVSSAAGATGSVAGQVARILGAKRVVGICGTEEKCCILTRELGFDTAINYKKDDVAAELTKACPEGIHVYFDNMVQNGHVILCGQIAMYNKDVPYPPPIEARLKEILQERNITRERFLVLNHAEKFEQSLSVLAEWYAAGMIKVKETVVEGLGNAPKAFASMMRGGNNNIGKLIICVNQP